MCLGNLSGSNFAVALAGMAARGGEPLQVGNGFDVPDDHVTHVAHSIRIMCIRRVSPHILPTPRARAVALRWRENDAAPLERSTRSCTAHASS